MKSFNYFLREQEVPSELRSLLYHIARSVKYINFSIRAGNTGKAKSQNSFGEDQVALDVMADDIIAGELEKSGIAALIASEEKEEAEAFDSQRGNYFVAYDPLDGSSLVNVNLAIGSIFGIWNHNDILNKKADEGMVASCYAVYGPRVTLVIAVKGKGVHEFELNDVGEFILTKEALTIAPQSKYFAPGNLRSCVENPNYKAWVDDCIMSGKTLRYSGGMVPDINHILIKGEGVFAYPSHSAYPTGKLRLLFECAPFAFVAREAGGTALKEDGTTVLDTVVTDYHQTTPIFIGSAEAVKQSVKLMS